MMGQRRGCHKAEHVKKYSSNPNLTKPLSIDLWRNWRKCEDLPESHRNGRDISKSIIALILVMPNIAVTRMLRAGGPPGCLRAYSRKHNHEETPRSTKDRHTSKALLDICHIFNQCAEPPLQLRPDVTPRFSCDSLLAHLLFALQCLSYLHVGGGDLAAQAGCLCERRDLREENLPRPIAEVFPSSPESGPGLPL